MPDCAPRGAWLRGTKYLPLSIQALNISALLSVILSLEISGNNMFTRGVTLFFKDLLMNIRKDLSVGSSANISCLGSAVMMSKKLHPSTRRK